RRSPRRQRPRSRPACGATSGRSARFPRRSGTAAGRAGRWCTRRRPSGPGRPRRRARAAATPASRPGHAATPWASLAQHLCLLMIMEKWSSERPDRHDHGRVSTQPRGDLEEKTNSVPQATAGFGVSVPGHWSRRGVVLSDMEFSRPATWADALAMKAGQPAALAIAGGTDVMVDINFDRVRPAALLDLTGISELAEWSADGTVIR